MNHIIYEDIQNIISRIPCMKLEGSVVLVTGATGLLCPYIIYTIMRLNETRFKIPCKVMVLSRDTEKIKFKFSEFFDKNYFIPVYGNVEDLVDYPLKADYIIHAAGIAVTSLFYSKPVDIWKANVLGSINLLEYAKKCQAKGFLFFSSGSVYGDCDDVKEDITEEMTSFPMDFMDLKNGYGQAKRIGEVLGYAYYKQYDVPTKSVRISHTYGPTLDLDDERVFCDFTKRILNSENIVIKGTGHDIRSFTYISDATVAFFLVLLNGDAGDAYNMANNKATVTIAELAEILTNEAFPERELKIIYPKNYKEDKLQGVHVSTRKLESLGWQPQVGIVEGFKRTLRSFEQG